MKSFIKTIHLIIIFSLFFCCGPRQDKVEKYVENGVQVVVNHLKPHKVEGEPGTFDLEREFSIDTERNGIASTGLTDIKAFDIDSEGNIFFLPEGKTSKFIYKFDRYGNFKTSFGDKGQGPGEIQFITYFGIDDQDRIVITDYGNKKLLVFSKDGNLIEETRLDSNIWGIIPLSNGNQMIVRKMADPEGDYIYQYPLILCNSEFEQIRELDRQRIPNFLKEKGRAIAPYIFIFSISDEKIYVANAVRGYEIWVYDFDGNLIRKIKKEYVYGDKKEFKKKVMEFKPSEESLKDEPKFPSQLPPFMTIFSDDGGRLFSMTYEKGDNSAENIVDIFNREGIFIGRASLKSLLTRFSSGPLYPFIRAKNDHLYILEKKESGYMILTVYNIDWKS